MHRVSVVDPRNHGVRSADTGSLFVDLPFMRPERAFEPSETPSGVWH
jgi:hypothetical protein